MEVLLKGIMPLHSETHLYGKTLITRRDILFDFDTFFLSYWKEDFCPKLTRHCSEIVREQLRTFDDSATQDRIGVLLAVGTF